MLTLEQQKLVEDNQGLIYSFLMKKNLSIEEYYGVAAIGLCKAAEVYNETKGAFSTVAYKCMLHCIAHELRKFKAIKRGNGQITLSYDVEIQNTDGDNCTLKDFIPNGDEFESLSCTKMVFKDIISSLKGKECIVLYLHLNGNTQNEIAKKLGISQPHASRLLNRCLIKLKEVI